MKEHHLLNHTNNIRLIHIGKCGGTYIQKNFKFCEYHLFKPKYQINHKYIIWIRNPLERFISAFNYSYSLITDDTSNYNINNLTLDNCLAPARIKYKMKNGHTFNKEYDDLVLFFKTPNDLAESITHEDNNIREKALKLMNHELEHIHKGIAWYLDNGDFIEKYNTNILFVGRIENMEEDCNKLAEILDMDIKLSDKIRENKKNVEKYLSEKAIINLINFYENSDYKALHTMYKYGMISKDVLESYYKISA